MLSVGSRGDGRKGVAGLQFGEEGVEMEENELEEGEAFSGKEEGEDDGGAPIDPDIALSYIDEKLQNVLGHFQKDFEGGVCAENLGAKFGGYGSFLPTYQRSPSVLSQARSPHVAGGSFNGVNPSCFSLPEASPQNNNILPTQSTSDNKTASHTSSNPSNKDAAPRKASSNQEFTPQHDTVSRSSNGSDQRPLKVRIKVGPESAPPRKNAAIYSRLGFDISPVSSPEDSPEGSGELFTGGHDSPDTPLTTFKFYSGLLATHLVACLLSPIHGDMLFMAEKKAPIKKEFNMEDNVSPKNDKSYGKNRKSSSDKGSKFSELDPSTKCGGNDVSGAVNRADAKPSIKKERIVNTLSPSLPVHPKYDYENLVRPPICERSKDSSAYRRPEKIAANEGKLSPGRVDKDPPGISKFGNGSAVGSKQKPSIESSSDEKILPNGGSNTYKDPKKFVKANNDDRISAIVKAESDGYAETDDLPVGPPESIKLRAPQRAISYEEVRGDVQEKDVSVGKKKKSKGSKSSSRQSKDKNKDYSNATSTAPLKEKKSNAVPTGEKDSKLNASKSEKDPNRKVSKGSTNYTPIVKVDHEDNRIKLGDARLDYQGGSAMPGDRMKERMVHKKTENPLLFQAEKGSAAAPVTGNEPGFEVAPPSADCWVQCDKCQKWRLCPPGVTPNDLPDKWLCNMLDWLPGMNRCSVSEEETTQALLAPYQPLAPLGQVAVDPVHYAASASGITSKDARQLNPDLTKANHTSVKSKKPSDVNPLSLEPTQHNRGNLYHGDNPSYLYAGKQKHKHAEKKERQEHYSKKGDSIEKGSKSMKSKTRKEFDQDGSRNSKKLKSAEFSNVKNDWHFNSNSSGERDFGATNDRSPEVSAKYRKKNSSPMDSRRSKLQLSGEIAKVPHRTSENSEVKEDYSNISDNSKKRKMKQLHGSRDQPIADVGTETQKEITESLIRTEKKPRASKFNIRDPNESKLSFESERHKPMSGTPLSGSRDEFHLQNAHDKHQQDADHMYQFSQRNANNVDHLKRDMGFSQTSTAATSSSSKISGSCRSKTNFQEVRGSPVESVSSSPLRTSATGKLTRRVDDTRNVDTFSKGSTGEYFSDIDGAYHQKQKASSAVRGGSLDCGKVPESRTMDPVDSVSNLTGKKTGPPAESKAQNILLSLFGHTDDEHSSEYEDTNVDASAVVTSEPPNNVSSEVQIRSHGDDLKLSRPDERNSQKMFSNNSGRNKEKHRNPEVDVSDEKRKFPAAESDQRDRNPAANNDAHGRSTHESSRSDKYNLEKIKKKNSSTKISGERTKDAKNVNLPNFAPENYDVSGSTLPAEKHRSSYSNVAGSSIASGNGEKSYFNEKVQDAIYKEDRGAPSLSRSDRMEKLNKSSGKSKKPETSLPLEDEQGGHDIVPQSVSTTAKESYPIPLTEKTLSSTPVSALKGASSKSGNRNETKSSSLMQLTPSRLDITTSKRDANVSVSSVLKEATDLKHTANRKKNEGLDHESTGLYFQAALKFLYGASLIERSNSESTKHGDPIQWYFQTAKLCEFCAHEYERRKEMSAAALAYKCVEVAYMKSVFLKNGVAAKDRIELQNAPQIGESPSSSASDVDNVNNQGALDKVAPDKKNNPLQGRHPGGGFVIPSRNRSSFSRILAFAEATNGAMEASKKSIHTLSCASSTVNEDSKKGVEGLFLVQRTLDFSFHDIEGLLRLVRQAMELINS